MYAHLDVASQMVRGQRGPCMRYRYPGPEEVDFSPMPDSVSFRAQAGNQISPGTRKTMLAGTACHRTEGRDSEAQDKEHSASDRGNEAHVRGDAARRGELSKSRMYLAREPGIYIRVVPPHILDICHRTCLKLYMLSSCQTAPHNGCCTVSLSGFREVSDSATLQHEAPRRRIRHGSHAIVKSVIHVFHVKCQS